MKKNPPSLRSIVRAASHQVASRRASARRKKVIGAGLVALAVTVASGREAHAQISGFGDDAIPLFATIVAADLGVAAGGITFGVGSATHASRKEISNRWFVPSYLFGGLNLALGAYYTSLVNNTGSEAIFGSLAALHLSTAVLDIVAPSVGYGVGRSGPEATPALVVRPVVVGGTDIAGHPWAGVGVGGFNF